MRTLKKSYNFLTLILYFSLIFEDNKTNFQLIFKKKKKISFKQRRVF